MLSRQHTRGAREPDGPGQGRRTRPGPGQPERRRALDGCQSQLRKLSCGARSSAGARRPLPAPPARRRDTRPQRWRYRTRCSPLRTRAHVSADGSVGTEVNFDGLPGPTHNYSGLATGNLASERNRSLVANPRRAALQGLAKMKALADRGFAQAVLPPHERPDMAALRALGFVGDDAVLLATAARQAPQLLAACSSAAAMWVANAATVSPSADTVDGRVHFTPANLVAHFHRSLEAATTTRVLRSIFADERRFVVHDPLPAAPQLGDEGAANHTRFDAGVELFVYGCTAFATDALAPRRFAARQTREACESVARRHGLVPERTLFAQQHPDAIDAGVFHNDVIAVGSGAVLFCHERAYVGQDALLAALRERIGAGFTPIVVPEREVSLERAVSTYLFNSQLLTRADGGLLLVAPAECRDEATVSALLDRL